MSLKRLSRPTEKAQAQQELQKARLKRKGNHIDDATQNKRTREDTASRGQNIPNNPTNTFDTETTTSVTNFTESRAESTDDTGNTNEEGQDENSNAELGTINLL